MKKIACLLMLLGLGLFTIGCQGDATTIDTTSDVGTVDAGYDAGYEAEMTDESAGLETTSEVDAIPAEPVEPAVDADAPVDNE